MRAKFFLYSLIIPFLFLFAPRSQQSAPAVTYVSASIGSDTAGDGSSARPFKTITKALRNAPSSSTIRVAAGVYDKVNGETFPVLMRNRIDLVGDRNAATITGIGVIPSGAFSRFPAVIVGADAAISEFQIIIPATSSGTGTYPPAGIFVPGSTQTFIIKSNDISSEAPSLSSRGIHVNGGSATILNNHIFNNGLEGIFTRVQPVSLVLRGNVIENNGKAANEFASGDGIYVIAESLDISGNTITNNSGIGIRTGTANASITQNLIVGNGNVGLYAFHPPGTIINASTNIWQSGIQGADASGHYAPQTILGAVGLKPGNNFVIQNQGSLIQF